MISRITYFNPHIPWGMWHHHHQQPRKLLKFQSTHPVRDVTCCFPPKYTADCISIHTSREGCDKRNWGCYRAAVYFNPHIPWGMWRFNGNDLALVIGFQSTHPVRDVTPCAKLTGTFYGISIHTSREGCDSLSLFTENDSHYFNPHIPWGMWPKKIRWLTIDNEFQSTHPVRDVTTTAVQKVQIKPNFNPHIPWGMWQHRHVAGAVRPGFQSTHPVRDVTGHGNRGVFRCQYFNPHIPWGMWPQHVGKSNLSVLFQSTHPVRDVTRVHWVP